MNTGTLTRAGITAGKGTPMRLKWIVLALLAALVAAPNAIAQDMRDPVTGQWISGRGKNLNSAPPRSTGFFSLFGGSSAIDPKYAPGSIVIVTKQRKLYFVDGPGRAIEYNIGVGRIGFTWSGVHKVTNKKEWPTWTPPAQMHARQKGLPKQMKGGPDNPLGARAIYLGSTLYRIHGSNDPDSIGQADSSGCFRMHNDDVIDLYSRVAIGATVYVIN
jgi:lipoprotein-anchoring transpeptidase ErfK/SrfK